MMQALAEQSFATLPLMSDSISAGLPPDCQMFILLWDEKCWRMQSCARQSYLMLTTACFGTRPARMAVKRSQAAAQTQTMQVLSAASALLAGLLACLPARLLTDWLSGLYHQLL